jgi:flavorubredoxin
MELSNAKTVVTELVPDVFRISTEFGTGQNVSCFLLRDEHPALVETGLGAAFDGVHAAVADLLDPATLRYVFVPWMAMDECGALNRFLQIAPSAEPVCSFPGLLALGDFSIRPPRPLADGEKIRLGAKTIVGIQTTWAPLLESMVFFDETDGLLFSADFFIQDTPGDPVTDEDRTEEMLSLYRRAGTFPSQAHLQQAVDKFEKLDAKMLCGMHGSCLTGDPRRYYRALREGDVAGLLEAPFYKGAFRISVGM